MEIVILVSGLTTKLMVEVHMNIWMELNILETGKKINNTAMELKHGLMKPNMKGIMSLVRNME